MAQALSVAKELVRLSLAGDEKDPLTNLRLQKLLYYGQAWSLVIREGELFSDDLVAWRHGPVVEAVYRGMPDGLSAHQIGPGLFEKAADLEPEEAEFVQSVWEAYNQYSALKLSRMTHEEMPWRKAWGDRPRDGSGNDVILVEDLEDYFAKQAMPAPLAAYSHEFRNKEDEAARKLLEIAPLGVGHLAAVSTSFTPAVSRLLAGGS